MAPGADLQHETTFPRQFILSPHEHAAPAGWRRDSLDGWCLSHCPSLPVGVVLDAEGTRAGWVLGQVFGGDTTGNVRLPSPVAAARLVEDLEAVLPDLAGGFVVVLVAAAAERLYMGPAGARAVVFNATERRIASSSTLATTEPQPDVELIEAFDIPQRDRYYPFGMTADRRVRRLLPNFYLDLRTFEPRRVWPSRATQFGTARDTAPLVSTIADRVRDNVAAFAGSRQVSLALTAGRDSRMVLAASRRLVQQVSCFVYSLPDKKAQVDVRVAAAIAKRERLPLDVVSWTDPVVDDLDAFQARVGHCVAGRVWQLATTEKRLRPARRVSAIGGEVGRCFFWRKEDLAGGRLSVDDVVNRLRLPLHPRVCAEAERWLSTLPVHDAPDVLDFLYLEQRLGCWAGPQAYGHGSEYFAPLCDQRVFEAMLALPHRYRFEQRLAADVVAYAWPQLLAYPFNRDSGPRVLERLRRTGRRAWRALRSQVWRE